MRFSLRVFHFIVFALLCTPSPCRLEAATARKAMVATADPHATRAALEVLQLGGNAVDAAIAAQWVLNVVEPQSSGIGGGGFFLYYEAATKRITFFDGREKAPAEAHAEMFLNPDGKPMSFYPDAITGGLPVGVPGTLKLLHTVHTRLGSKVFSFSDLFRPAIRLAEEGFPVSERLSRSIRDEQKRLKKFKASRKIFFDRHGRALKPESILVQPDLAKTFRSIQQKGISLFYEGEIAEAIVESIRSARFHPGLMKKDDLFYYDIEDRNPLHGTYRGYDVFSVGPPSSGGAALLEALNILEFYELRVHGRTPDGMHLLAEAQKLAFRDRDRYQGDADFVKVPVKKLISKKHARKKSEEIRFDAVIPARDPAALENIHTSHLSIVDSQGNMAAFTTTIEYVFGSAMTVPGWGFILNNELTDFELDPRDGKGGLVPNAAEGEKRPRSSMTPAFVFKRGRPVLIVGSPGGSKIIGTVLNVIVNFIDFKMSLQDAVRAPRLLNRDGAVELEAELYENTELRQALEARGHAVVKNPVIGNVQAVAFHSSENEIWGESDPRGEGEAMGY